MINFLEYYEINTIIVERSSVLSSRIFRLRDVNINLDVNLNLNMNIFFYYYSITTILCDLPVELFYSNILPYIFMIRYSSKKID